MHDAALKYGKYYGNAGEQYLTGYTVSADTRMVQNGPACDGWRPAGAGRGRGTGPDEEPVIGLPGRRAGSRRRRRRRPAGGRRSPCWPWMAPLPVAEPVAMAAPAGPLDCRKIRAMEPVPL